MAQRNLLDIVNSILEPLEEKTVDTIDETTRSYQVAAIVRDTYFEGLANRNWPHKKELQGLQPRGAATPTHLIIPSSVKEIIEIRYDVAKTTDTRKKFRTIEYKTPIDFLDFTNSRNSSKSDVVEVEDPTGTSILIKDDKAPEYWTSFDQKSVVFDSFDKAVDSTIREEKQQTYVVTTSDFLFEDDYVPDLPEEALPWLLAEAKSVAFVDIAQESNVKAEQKSRRQQQWLSRKSRTTGRGYSLPSYGRRSKK